MRADDPMLFLPTDPIPYQKIRPKLGTGDLVFLQTASTQGLLIEAVERLFGLPAFSHVGMVIKDDELLLWDAPGGGHCFHDPYADAHSDNRVHKSPVHPGCRVSRLDEVLGYYKTKTKARRPWFLGSSTGPTCVGRPAHGAPAVRRSG